MSEKIKSKTKSVSFADNLPKVKANSLNSSEADLLAAFQSSRKRKLEKKSAKDKKHPVSTAEQQLEEKEAETLSEPTAKRHAASVGPLTLKERIHQSVEAKLARKEEAEMLDQLRDDVDEEWTQHIRFLVNKKPPQSKINAQSSEEQSMALLNLFSNEVRDLLQPKVDTTAAAARESTAEMEEKETSVPDARPRDLIYSLRVFARREPQEALRFLCNQLIRGMDSNPPRYFLFCRIVLEILQSTKSSAAVFVPELCFALDAILDALVDEEEPFIPTIPKSVNKFLTLDNVSLTPADCLHPAAETTLSGSASSDPTLWLKCFHQFLHQLHILLNQLPIQSTNKEDGIDSQVITPLLLHNATLASLYTHTTWERFTRLTKSRLPTLVRGDFQTLMKQLTLLNSFLQTLPKPVFAVRPKVTLIPLMDPCLEFPKEEEKKKMSRNKRERKASMKKRKREGKQKALQQREEIQKKQEVRRKKTKKLITQLKAQEWMMKPKQEEKKKNKTKGKKQFKPKTPASK